MNKLNLVRFNQFSWLLLHMFSKKITPNDFLETSTWEHLLQACNYNITIFTAE